MLLWSHDHKASLCDIATRYFYEINRHRSENRRIGKNCSSCRASDISGDPKPRKSGNLCGRGQHHSAALSAGVRLLRTAPESEQLSRKIGVPLLFGRSAQLRAVSRIPITKYPKRTPSCTSVSAERRFCIHLYVSSPSAMPNGDFFICFFLCFLIFCIRQAVSVKNTGKFT